MKLIMIFVFSYSLHVLTLMADKTPILDKTETTTWDSSWPSEQSSDSLGFQDRFPSRQKRGLIKSCTGRWRKVNSSPVCFGARNHQFGRFFMPSSGRLAAIKLVHLYGYVSCSKHGNVDHWSYWGCGYSFSLTRDKVNVVITTSSNHIILPPNQFLNGGWLGSAKWHEILGYNSWSPELVFSVFSHPLRVSSGQQLRVWYGEDLVDLYETDNGGRVCCDVYARYVWRDLLPCCKGIN